MTLLARNFIVSAALAFSDLLSFTGDAANLLI